MFSRRHLLTGGVGLAASLPLLSSLSKVEASTIVNEDGLHQQDWFLESFLELNDDLAVAQENGKRFAIMWELKGCPYCRETHLVNFAQKEIQSFVSLRFEILQLNLIGSRVVTDFDGEELSEKALARKYGVRFTPTIQYFPEVAEGLAEMSPAKREVARMAGYMKPEHFLSMFRYVDEKSYEEQSFRAYLKASLK